jgi:diguanylate cyclase (GGDEF)-like protein
MPDLSRDVVPVPERPLDAVLDAAAKVTAIVTVAGELAHWEGAWRPDGDTWFDAIPEGEHFAAREALSRAASGGAPVEVDLNVRASGGELRHISWRMAAPDGDLAWVIATGTDAVERARIEEQVQLLVGRDALTGLLNRPRFEEELGRHVAHGRRYGIGGALIVIDLNGFRSINEEHGPRAGDRVLIAVAKSLANRLRETDLLARIGGDQFAVLLPRAKPPEAERVCQALEDAIPEEAHAPRDRRVEASVGFVPFTETMNSVDEAMLAAHAAMYAVKAGAPRHIRRLRPLD